MPLPGLVAAAIPAVSGLANSLIARGTSIRNVNATNRANRELAEYAYSKDLEMWNRMNEYNTPLAQMARFKEAGLNPNLIYGQGTPGNAATMPKYNAPTMDYTKRLPLQIPEVVGTYQNLMLQQAQIDNVKERTEETKINQGIKNLDKIAKDKTLNDRVRQEAQKTLNMIQDLAVKKERQALIKKMTEHEQVKMDKTELERIFQEHKNEWMKHGITNSDNIMFRMLVQLMAAMGLNPLGSFFESQAPSKVAPQGYDPRKN